LEDYGKAKSRAVVESAKRGRAERKRETGDACTFVTRKDRDLAGNIERVLDEKPARRTPEDFDYAVPASEGGGGFRRS